MECTFYWTWWRRDDDFVAHEWNGHDNEWAVDNGAAAGAVSPDDSARELFAD